MKAYFKLADIVVEATFQYEYLLKQCKDYCIKDPVSVDMEVVVDADDLAREKASGMDGSFPDYYIESLAFYRKFAQKAIAFDCILFHGSALSIDGECFLFGAPSGTGKSTHSALYRKVFGDRVVMVNDDKPLIRRKGDIFYVYGTPWNGKHRLSNNISVPLKGLCFLKQGSENVIRPLSIFEALSASLSQIYRPEQVKAYKGILSFTRDMVTRIHAFELVCTISKEAAELSYRTMKGAQSQ